MGFDVSEKKIATFAICGEKTSKDNPEISNDPEAIKQFLKIFPDPKNVCVVMETGTHSLWMSELIRKLGFEVIVAHARDLALIYGTDKKNDKLDAEKLARLAQADKKLLHPVEHMTMERQTDLMVVKSRDLVVRQRVQTINAIRGFLRSCGCKMIEAEYTADSIKKCCSELPAEVKPAIIPLLQHICYCDRIIKDYDRQIRKLCQKYHETDILRQIPGVGELTALAFVLIIGNPKRFKNAQRLCAYLGLVPKQDQSGDTDKQLGITKQGKSCHPAGPGGLDSGLRVLHHGTIFGWEAQLFRCAEEHLRIRLGVCDVCAVSHRVEEAAQADSIENKGGVFAGRADGKPVSSVAQLLKCGFHFTNSSADF